MLFRGGMGLHGIKVFIGYFHWLSWEKLPVHKNYGGMGFKDLAAINVVMLGKQGWKLQTDSIN